MGKTPNTDQTMVLAQQQCLAPDVINMQAQWAAAVQTAQSIQLQDNSCAAFQAVTAVQLLRTALTDNVMNTVFIPLMNTKIGFKTDRDPNRAGKNGPVTPYPANVVRDCLIDAMCIGLLPTGNQFNIIAGSMYPTKEGYTALLNKIECKYIISLGPDQQPKDAPFAEIPCRINYEQRGDKGGYNFIATVKKDGYSSMDQLRGKAERRAKKSLYEYLTGCDFGEADEQEAIEVQANEKTQQPIGFAQAAPQAAPQAKPQQAPSPQPQAIHTQQQAMASAAQATQGSWRQQRAAQPQQTTHPGF